jgi:hypothetical protein
MVGARHPEADILGHGLELQAGIVAPFAQVGDAEIDRAVKNLLDGAARALLREPNSRESAGPAEMACGKGPATIDTSPTSRPCLREPVPEIRTEG